MRKFTKQQETFKSFPDLVQAASTKYTLSFKAACKELKCSRTWAQTYIRPNVPSIYLSNGKGTRTANYAKLVSLAVNMQQDNDIYSNESVYLDEQAFNTFILESISSCRKRSKRVYKTFFVKEDAIEVYYEELLNLYSHLIFRRGNKSETEKIEKAIDILYLKYAKNSYVEKIIHPAVVVHTKRTEAEFVDVKIPDTPIQDWKAVHDLMDYGDIEETIYRTLFKEGCIRIELKIPDKNGVIKDTGKVYYLDDPNPIHPVELDEQAAAKILAKYPDGMQAEILHILKNHLYGDEMNIQQKVWIEYNNLLENNLIY